MLSISKTGTSNFLIGNNFNTSRSPSPAAACIPLTAFKRLEILLTRPKSITSDFLIDNFCTPSASLFVRTSSFEPPTSSSNRHIPELESPVSHRKQRIEPTSNRHKIAFCNFRLHAPAAPHPLPARNSRLSTIICQLRYNGGVKIECNPKGDKK